MANDLFTIQNEIPERFREIYGTISAMLEQGNVNIEQNDIAAEAGRYNDALLLLLSEREAESLALKELIQSLSERKSRIEKQGDQIRSVIMQLLILSNQERIQSTFGTSYRIKLPYSNIEIEDEVTFLQQNPQYSKVTTRLDRQAVLADLKDGVVIDGIKVADRESVGIRR